MELILNKIIKFNELNLVSVFRTEESEVFNLLKIKKNNSKLEILSTDSFISFEDLKGVLDIKIPIVLHVDGKGVLNKRIELNNEVDRVWLKNLDYSTIHFLSYTNLRYQFLSFCRKNVAEDIVEKIQKENYQIIDLYIGCLSSVLFINTINKTKIISGDYALSFDNNELVEIEKNINTDDVINYELGDKVLSNYQLPLYGAGVNFYLKQKEITKSHCNSINVEEVYYKKAFDKLGVIMIITFFFLLLTSYTLIQYFNSKNAQLNLESVYSNQSFKLLQKLEKQKENKLKIVNETGIASSKFITFFSYDLTKSIPSELNLLDVNVFPVINEVKATERVEFSPKIIVVKGFTNNEPKLNEWFQQIRAFSWINNLEIISIKRDKKNVSYFEIKILIKNV